MRLQITHTKGMEIRNDVINFESRKNQWRTLNTSTMVSINAGTYKLRLTSRMNKKIGFQALDIQ